MVDPTELADEPLPPAGWHPDPEQPQTWRYWDGKQWTDQRAPISVGGARRSVPTEILVAGGCAAGMVVGAIGPWVNAGFFSIGGLNGDGIIVLVAAVVGAGAAVAAANRPSGGYGAVATLILLAGFVGAATSIYDIINIETSANTEIFGEEIQIGSPGWGLWLSAAASVGLGVSGAAIFQIKR